MTYASFGNATSAHLAGALFSHLAQVELTHVPYRGSGPALTDLLAGRVDMLFATAATVAGATSGGRLRAIAVTSAERSAAFPGVPTVAEAGVPGYASEGWYGLYAPAGTPRETIDRLNAAANQAIRTETFQRQVAEEGMTIVGGHAGATGGLCPYRGDPLAGGGAARQHHRRIAGASACPLVPAARNAPAPIIHDTPPQTAGGGGTKAIVAAPAWA